MMRMQEWLPNQFPWHFKNAQGAIFWFLNIENPFHKNQQADWLEILMVNNSKDLHLQQFKFQLNLVVLK